ncbi:DMT family transporter [Croceicoccus ponticola]|uniref:DMT family transporter n=1 Tax=Croceicoccus ponticola TaxID=2217664 RepID=A0A437H269_9SPHN|nr:DMT family transporter [Croceicoccus ponticola]RVQ69744.1 DMT family transporter [Croceicoccus ponticola]
MAKRKIDWLTYAMLGATIAFWAGNAIVGRMVRGDIDPVSLALLRWIGAALVVAPIAWRGLRADLPAIRAAWKPVLALCVTGIVGFNTLLYEGLLYTTASNALLMQATIPALVLVIAALVFKQREATWKVVGIALSVCGAAFTIFRGNLQAAIEMQLGKGDLLVFGACVTWAIYTVLLRLAPKVRPASLLFVMFAGGALILLPVALMMPGRQIAWNAQTVGAVAYIAVLPSVVAYFLFNAAVARAGAAIAGQAIALMPVAGALLAALLLGEKLHWYHAVGMVIIVAGIAIAAVQKEPQAQ